MVAALVVMVMVVLVMVFLFQLQLSQFHSNRGHSLHGLQQLSAGQFRPRGCNDRCTAVMLTKHRNRSIQFLLRYRIGTGHDNARSCLHLIVEKFAKVFHVNLDLSSVYHGHGIAEDHLVIGNFLYGTNYVRKLTHTGGFNNNTVGMVIFNYLHKSSAEITNQAAADAAGIHFRNIHACILQKTAIDTDLTKLILNENQFLSLIALLNHFLDQSGLTGSQKARININFCHSVHLSISITAPKGTSVKHFTIHYNIIPQCHKEIHILFRIPYSPQKI